MDASQIDAKGAIDEDPDVVIASKSEIFGARVGERRVHLTRTHSRREQRVSHDSSVQASGDAGALTSVVKKKLLSVRTPSSPQHHACLLRGRGADCSDAASCPRVPSKSTPALPVLTCA